MYTHPKFLKINEIRFFGRLILMSYLVVNILSTMLQQVNILSFSLHPFNVNP